jgi:hypothetical protein
MIFILNKDNTNFSLIFMQDSAINNSFLASQDENEACEYVNASLDRGTWWVIDRMDL